MLDNKEVFARPSDLPGFSYAVQGDLDLSSIKGSRSTTFKLPASITNSAVVGGASMSENRPATMELRIGMAGEDYHRAMVKPVLIDRNEVRFVAVGGNAGWMDGLKAMKINELDLGEEDQVTPTLQRTSWEDYDRTVVYPLIDYGFIADRASTFSIDPRFLRPGVRIWKILRRAFADLGYNIIPKGEFTKVWKKLFIPNTVERIPATPRFLLNFTSAVKHNGTEQFTPYFSNEVISTPVPADTVTVDPSGQVTFVTQAYQRAVITPQLTGTYKVSCVLTVTVDHGVQIGAPWQYRMRVVHGFSTTTPVVLTQGDFSIPDNPGVNTWKVGVDFGEVELTENLPYFIVIARQYAVPPSYFHITDCLQTWTPVAFQYQEGVSFMIAPTLPSIKAIDVLKDVVNIFCLVVDTDDRTKTATIQFYDDYVRPTTEGRSLLGREDFDKAPSRQIPQRPSTVLFTFRDDSKDEGLKQFIDTRDRTLGEYEYFNEEGVTNPAKVSIAFAPTAMVLDFEGDILIPGMREDEGDFQVDHYKRDARILVHDGLSNGNWTHAGDALTVFPNCYFAKPGQVWNMAFDEEDQYGPTGPGTVDRYWSNRLRRYFLSDILEIDLRLYDDELLDVAFGVPVLVHDGHEPSWYLWNEIKQKRFGVIEPTRCKLTKF